MNSNTREVMFLRNPYVRAAGQMRDTATLTVVIDGRTVSSFHDNEDGRRAMLGWLSTRITFAEAVEAQWLDLPE